MKNDSLKEQYRINERIRVREVRLVGAVSYTHLTLPTILRV